MPFDSPFGTLGPSPWRPGTLPLPDGSPRYFGGSSASNQPISAVPGSSAASILANSWPIAGLAPLSVGAANLAQLTAPPQLAPLSQDLSLASTVPSVSSVAPWSGATHSLPAPSARSVLFGASST